ncbi:MULTISPECIES: hypothetical protein [Pseudonocardia]|nr:MULTISPECIES: hypothetical protein [Pseudonocardia]GEC25264.1 hypothetical protein PSA01_22930 [Pseudonocardia saturnea]
MSTGDGRAAGDGGQPAGGLLALPAAGLRLAAALTARPSLLLRRGGGWVLELGRVGLGSSTATPPDDEVAADPVRRRLAQVQLVTTDALSGLLDDAAADGSPLPPQDADRLRALLLGPTGAGAPERPSGSADPGADSDPVPVPDGPGPDAARRVFTAPGPGDPGVPFDTGARDARGGPVAGRDVAATPGAVVLRTPVFELLQYLPVTERVHDAPVLVVPPLIHRYWLADLAPGYSLVEHLLGRGLQVFALSWRPAGPADAGRDLDAHAAAVLDALEACTRIARAPRVSLLGVRTGGLLAAAVQAHQAAIGLDDRVAGVGYLATVLDQSDALPGFRPDPAVTRAAAEQAARDGVLDGPTAVSAWTWRRGTDRVLPWAVPDTTGGAVSGRAARAIRAWAADLLPLPAALHTDLAALADSTFGSDDDDSGGVRVLGTPVRPAELRRDGYLVAAADDPVQPWTGGHRTARMLGGSCRLVLAPGDQAGALIAPPRAGGSFRAASCGTGDGDPQAWLAAASRIEGSWWEDLAGWLIERSGTLRDAPPELGGRRLRPLFPAPGTYLGAGDGHSHTPEDPAGAYARP